MIKNYLLITFRGLLKNKIFIAINVFGMAIAIACCIVGYLAHNYDATFDDNHVNRNEIYRVSSVREFENTMTRYGIAPFALGEVTANAMADVDQASRYIDMWSTFRKEDDLFPVEVSYVDADFFNIFTFDFISGKPSDLNDKSAAVIDAQLAIRLFNSPEGAVDKIITQLVGNDTREVRIAGVIHAQPANSSFQKKSGAMYMSVENYDATRPDFRRDDWRNECTLFVRISDDTRVPKVQQQLQSYVANNNKVREDFQVSAFTLDNFDTMAHRDRAEGVLAKTWAAPPIAAIIGSIVMSILILLIACFNLTNTSIALSARRLKEIGIRKVMGSKRFQLIIQFIGETTCICFLALIVGLALSDFLVAGWNVLTSNNIHLSSGHLASPDFLLFLIGVLLFTGILAGSYPAFYISKFEPVKILKGKLKFGGTSYFTRTLLGLQFVVCMMAIASGIGFFQNARYQREFDLGFDVRGAVVATVNNQNEFDTYKNALQENASIKVIAGARTGIFSDREHIAVKHAGQQLNVDLIEVGDNYVDAMDLKLVEGRDFVRDSESDKAGSVIITQKMADAFGWKKSLGQEIIWRDTVKLYVVGVVKDVYTRGLWQELEPMMIRFVSPDQYRQIVVNGGPENATAVNSFMEEKWGSIFPNRLYNGRMLDDNVKVIHDLSLSIVYSYAFLGIVAMLLSITGLFSLVSLNIVKRMKEIGVRKLLGASVFNIARVINFEFMIIFVIAMALGSWAAFNWTSMVMGSIWKYYQPVNAITFTSAIALLLTVSLLAIGSRIFAVATMNPVKSLKEE